MRELGPPRAGVREPSARKDAASLVKALPGLFSLFSGDQQPARSALLFLLSHQPRLPFGDNATSLPWEDSSGGFMFVGFHETENGQREFLSQTPPPSFPSFLIGINI